MEIDTQLEECDSRENIFRSLLENVSAIYIRNFIRSLNEICIAKSLKFFDDLLGGYFFDEFLRGWN